MAGGGLCGEEGADAVVTTLRGPVLQKGPLPKGTPRLESFLSAHPTTRLTYIITSRIYSYSLRLGLSSGAPRTHPGLGHGTDYCTNRIEKLRLRVEHPVEYGHERIIWSALGAELTGMSAAAQEQEVIAQRRDTNEVAAFFSLLLCPAFCV